MDNKKVEEALGEIFDKCGVGIVGEPIKFRSAFFDLLDEWHYKDERIVFRYAIESGALWPLASAAAPITGGMVAQVMEKLRKSHMTEDDAEFVVQCIIAARGGEPDIVMDYKKRQKEERGRREETQKQLDEKQKRQKEERERREEKQKQPDEKQKRQEEQRRQEEITQAIIYSDSCRYRKKGVFGSKRGTVQVDTQELKLISQEGKQEAGIHYKDILVCKTEVIQWCIFTVIKMLLGGCLFWCVWDSNWLYGVISMFEVLPYGYFIGYYSAVAAVIAGVLIILILNLAAGFPVCITLRGGDAYYLRMGSAAKRQILKEKLKMYKPLMHTDSKEITERLFFRILNIMVYAVMMGYVLYGSVSDAAWYEEPTIILPAVSVLTGILHTLYLRHRIHNGKDINKWNNVCSGLLMLLPISLCLYTPGEIYEIVLERIAMVSLEFLIVLIIRGMTTQVLDGVTALRQKR